MDTRKHHKKSRTGCVQCKQRRVKCDEQKPTCKNCMKNYAQCSLQFLTPAAPGVRTLRSNTQFYQGTPLILLSTTSPPFLDNSLPNPRSLPTSNHTPQTLELLHHYHTALHSSLDPSCPPQIWNSAVPYLSLTHPFILPAILAISALHLASLVPARCSHLHLLSFQYEARALPTFRRLMAALPPIDSSVNGSEVEDFDGVDGGERQPGRQTIPAIPTKNIHALFACASHIAYYVLASPSPSGIDRFRLPSREDAHPHWWQSMRGFMSFLNMHWMELAEGPMGGSISRERIPGVLDLGSVDDLWLVHLDGWLSGMGGQDERVKTNVLRQALLSLRHIFAFTHLPHPTARLATRAWPGMVSQAYTELLYERDSAALVVLACYCVLLKRIGDVWYLRGLGEGLLGNIVKELGIRRREGEREWGGVMEWALGRECEGFEVGGVV